MLLVLLSDTAIIQDTQRAEILAQNL
jgi:hypothetical protein